jgi:hypothetical protein
MAEITLPEPCDLAVNFFDSLTYLADRTKVVQHLRSVADSLAEGALYILEIGVIDDFENHNVEEVWTEKRRDFSVTSTYLRDGGIDPERRTFIEHCTFGATCGEHTMFLVLKQAKMALYFDEFKELVQKAGCFTPLAYYDEFASGVFLPQDELPWRVIAVLQKTS